MAKRKMSDRSKKVSAKGKKFDGWDAFVDYMGNPITVNGKVYPATKHAATFICNTELLSGNVRNHNTVNRELRRLIHGTRGAWFMYGKYKIEHASRGSKKL